MPRSNFNLFVKPLNLGTQTLKEPLRTYLGKGPEHADRQLAGVDVEPVDCLVFADVLEALLVPELRLDVQIGDDLDLGYPLVLSQRLDLEQLEEVIGLTNFERLLLAFVEVGLRDYHLCLIDVVRVALVKVLELHCCDAFCVLVHNHLIYSGVEVVVQQGQSVVEPVLADDPGVVSPQQEQGLLAIRLHLLILVVLLPDFAILLLAGVDLQRQSLVLVELLFQFDLLVLQNPTLLQQLGILLKELLFLTCLLELLILLF